MSKKEKYQIQLQQAIHSKASFMNTTKWMYLFSILKETKGIYSVKVKLLLGNEIRELTLPNKEHLIKGKFIEEYWGVFELKEIEWILIPSGIIEQLEEELQKGKQYEYEHLKSGLKIYGYR